MENKIINPIFEGGIRSLPITDPNAKIFINRYINQPSRIIKDSGGQPIFGYVFDSADIIHCITNVMGTTATQNDFGLFFGIDNNNKLKLISIKFDISNPNNPIPQIGRMYEYCEPINTPYILP